MSGRFSVEAPPLSHREEVRVFLGFLVQPVVAALVGLVIFHISGMGASAMAPSGAALSGPTRAALAFAFATGLVAFVITPVAALPLFVWLRRRGPITLAKTLVSGAVLGNVLTVVAPAPVAMVFGTAVGVTCAGVFWWIAGRYLESH